MSLLDGLVKGAMGNVMGDMLGKVLGGSEASSSIVTELMGSVLGDKGAGLSDIMNGFKEKGLGDVVNSWVGNGENSGIDASQIKDVMGSQVSAIAGKLGLDEGDVAGQLSAILPNLVDKLSPEGGLSENLNMDTAMDLLKKFL